MEKKNKGGNLTPKQRAFAKEYLIDLNATQAAIRAGYSPRTASQQGERLLRKVEVKELVCIGKAERGKRTQVNADYVLRRLAEIDQMDAADILDDKGTLLPIKQWPKSWRQLISGFDAVERTGQGPDGEQVLTSVLKKVKWPDKLKNLELLGKHVDVSAFSEKVDHKHTFSGPNGEPLEFVIKTVYVHPDNGASS